MTIGVAAVEIVKNVPSEFLLVKPFILILFFLFTAQRLFDVPALLYSLLVCGKVAFQQTLDVYADRCS